MSTEPNPVPPLVRKVYRHTRKNAEVRGLSFELTNSDFEDLWLEADGRCMLTGIPFDPEPSLFYRRNPYAPSIDRTINQRGYTRSNCRLVLACVNIALNEWGDGVLMEVARGLMGFAPELADRTLLPRSKLKSKTLPRGITVHKVRNKVRYRVRVFPGGALKELGIFSTVPAATKRLAEYLQSVTKRAV